MVRDHGVSTTSLRRSGKTRHLAAFQAVAERKLQMLDSASTLDFLKSPPGNRLEALTGDRAGQYSIHVHVQWRICFVGTELGPLNVEIVDDH